MSFSELTTKKLLKILGYSFAVIFLFGMFFGGLLTAFLLDLSKTLPSVASLEDYHPSTITRIYSKEGILIKEFFSERRDVVSIVNVSEVLKNSIISIEDTRFYKHHGIDIFGIIRAAIRNLMAGQIVEGGSTITQQLSKQLFLTPERSFNRKIKELILSLKVERQFDKDKILELYMNQIYFGHGAYGVESASLTFFGKHANELNLSESALLAALIKAPNKYSPFRNPELSKSRRIQVLRQMHKEGYITEQEENEALSSRIDLKSESREDNTGEYFVEHIRRTSVKKFGQNIFYKNGLTINTTMDYELQQVADEVIKNHLETLNEHYPIEESLEDQGSAIQAALIAISARDGRILAMTGGSNFQESEFNRAIQARRQPGSSFKPIVYTAAIMSGMTAADIIIDSPVILSGEKEEDEWRPENFEQKFYGSTSLRKGLAKSRNLVTIKLTENLGINKVIKSARLMGINSPMERDLSISLGSCALSLLELTNAFNVIASGGSLFKPMFYSYIEDGLGNRIEENHSESKRVITEQVAYIMSSLLRSVITSGTGYNALVLGKPLAGKTGTTNDYRDAWFIGFSPSLTVGVWVGRDNMKPIGERAIGSKVALPIWIDFMEKYLRRRETENFDLPSGIISREICSETGLLASDKCEHKYNEVFIEGTEPIEHCRCYLPKKKTFIQYDLGM